jgi:hypothetical protein
MSHVGQDCILQAGFSTGLLGLSSPVRRAPMKSTLQLAKLPHKLSRLLRHQEVRVSSKPEQADGASAADPGVRPTN